MRRLFSTALLASLMSDLGCNATVETRKQQYNSDGSLAKPYGIPWVEPRLYDIYVFRGNGGGTAGSLLHHSRTSLLKEVNSTVIDQKRNVWETNYSAGMFADGTLSMEISELGTLSKIEITTAPEVKESGEAIAQALTLDQALKQKELERLELEKKLRDAEAALKPTAP